MRILKNKLQLGSSGKQLLLPSPSSGQSGRSDGQDTRNQPMLASQTDIEITPSVTRQRSIRPAAAYLAQLSLQYDAIDQLRAERRERRLRAAHSYQQANKSDKRQTSGEKIQRVA